MANEGGEWIMHGMDWDDPFRIRTWRELINYINQVGFLPLFANEVPGFSVEDHVSNLFWWTDDPEQVSAADPVGAKLTSTGRHTPLEME